jgi:hypothetical protein
LFFFMVLVVTPVLFKGRKLLTQDVRLLEKYMVEQGYATPEDFRGLALGYIKPANQLHSTHDERSLLARVETHLALKRLQKQGLISREIDTRSFKLISRGWETLYLADILDLIEEYGLKKANMKLRGLDVIVSEDLYGPYGYADDIWLCAWVADIIRREVGSDDILTENWDGEAPLMPLLPPTKELMPFGEPSLLIMLWICFVNISGRMSGFMGLLKKGETWSMLFLNWQRLNLRSGPSILPRWKRLITKSLIVRRLVSWLLVQNLSLRTTDKSEVSYHYSSLYKGGDGSGKIARHI